MPWRRNERPNYARDQFDARIYQFEEEVRLNMMQNLKFLNQFALVGLALLLSTGIGKAQNDYEGKFTLPFEARWGGTVLPAGDYTISMRWAAEPYLFLVRREGRTAIIMAHGTSMKTVSNDSHLTVLNTGGNQAITELAAGQLGLTFSYAPPKMRKTTEARLHAPMQNVPVSPTGN
jgi:hypothetical protein